MKKELIKLKIMSFIQNMELVKLLLLKKIKLQELILLSIKLKSQKIN